MTADFPAAPSVEALETGDVLAPRFGPDGLIAAIAQHAETGEVLMLAWMNAEALRNRDGSRLMSVYRDLGCQELWVITDGYGNDPTDPDQCYTTVLFPSDY